MDRRRPHGPFAHWMSGFSFELLVIAGFAVALAAVCALVAVIL